MMMNQFTPTKLDIKIALLHKRMVLPAFTLVLSVVNLIDDDLPIESVFMWLFLGLIALIINGYCLIRLLVIIEDKNKKYALLGISIAFIILLLISGSSLLLIIKNISILLIILTLVLSMYLQRKLKKSGWIFGLLGAKQVSIFNGLKKKHLKQCINCKKKMNIEDKYCNSCGSEHKIEILCKKCDTPNKLDAKFCSSCGNQV